MSGMVWPTSNRTEMAKEKMPMLTSK